MANDMREINIQVKNRNLRHGFEVATYYRQNAAMNLARIRKLRGLTQTELAEMANVTQPTISRAERGDDGITIGTYRGCAEALGVTLSDLFSDQQSGAEMIILEAFRRLPPERQKGWLDLAHVATAETQSEVR